MNKIEKVLIGIFGLGIIVFFSYCITEGITGFGIAHGFERGYFSEFGVILVVSCLGLFAVLVSHAMRNRKNKGKKTITNADRIWFRLSLIPLLLIVLYGVYSAIFKGVGINAKKLYTYAYIKPAVKIRYRENGKSCF